MNRRVAAAAIAIALGTFAAIATNPTAWFAPDDAPPERVWLDTVWSIEGGDLLVSRDVVVEWPGGPELPWTGGFPLSHVTLRPRPGRLTAWLARLGLRTAAARVAYKYRRTGLEVFTGLRCPEYIVESAAVVEVDGEQVAGTWIHVDGEGREHRLDLDADGSLTGYRGLRCPWHRSGRALVLCLRVAPPENVLPALVDDSDLADTALCGLSDDLRGYTGTDGKGREVRGRRVDATAPPR